MSVVDFGDFRDFTSPDFGEQGFNQFLEEEFIPIDDMSQQGRAIYADEKADLIDRAKDFGILSASSFDTITLQPGQRLNLYVDGMNVVFHNSGALPKIVEATIPKEQRDINLLSYANPFDPIHFHSPYQLSMYSLDKMIEYGTVRKKDFYAPVEISSNLFYKRLSQYDSKEMEYCMQGLREMKVDIGERDLSTKNVKTGYRATEVHAIFDTIQNTLTGDTRPFQMDPRQLLATGG